MQVEFLPAAPLSGGVKVARRFVKPHGVGESPTLAASFNLLFSNDDLRALGKHGILNVLVNRKSEIVNLSEGRQIQAGCTCLENRIGARRGRSVTDAFRQHLTPNERKPYETRYPLPKSVALPQKLQTKSFHSNPSGAEAEHCIPPSAFRSPNQNV